MKFNNFSEEGDLLGMLTPDVVNFLVKTYAKDQGADLNWAYKRNLEHDDYGIYYYNSETLYVNINSTIKDFDRQVDTILHEIQHHNQNLDWQIKKNRLGIVKGKKLPMNVNLNLLEIWDLHEFWTKTYGYENSPHEVDARVFARSKIDEALNSIIQQELGIPDEGKARIEIEKSRGMHYLLSNIPPDQLEQMKLRITNDFIDYLERDKILDKKEINDLKKNPKMFQQTELFKQFFNQEIKDMIRKKKNK